MASGGTRDVAVLCTATVGTRVATVTAGWVVACPSIPGSAYRRSRWSLVGLVFPLVGKLLWLSHVHSRGRVLFGDPDRPATLSHNAKCTPTIHYIPLNWMHTMQGIKMRTYKYI